MSWVLVEVPMDQMRIPIATMSAFVETPFDALAGVVFDDWLPIQGVAYDRGNASEYVENAVIAFPPQDGANVASVNEEKKIFSLLVNLAPFSPGDVVRIGLYGIVFSYNISGGDGTDGPFFGSVTRSDFYGTLTRHYSQINPMSPGGFAGATRYLKIHQSTIGFGHDRLVATFPELAAYPYEYGSNGIGEIFGVGWQWDLSLDPDAWQGIQPTIDGVLFTMAPRNDPNSFFVYPPNKPFLYSYWGLHAGVAGFEKIGSSDGGTTNAFVGPFPTIDNLTTIPSPPPAGKTTADISGSDNQTYFVPTWHFNNDRPVPINVATSGAILWTKQAEHVYPRPAYSYTWETNDYPTRPEMAEIATGVISSHEERADPGNPYNDYPYNHFGESRVGTITIVVPDSPLGSPVVSFAPEVAAPVDGGVTGDGPDGDGTAPGRTANPQLRVWTFTLDGHDFYVLRLGDTLTLVYDAYSEQWMDWTDFDSLTWRAHCGSNWIGAQALADTYGSTVVVGDDAYGLLWFLDPKQPYDDAPASGSPAIYFSRVTVGQVLMTGREVLPCYAAWLTTDMGAPAYLGAGVTLYSSDDAGVTWDNHGFVNVTPNGNSPELSWYSLGQIAAPGRLFKIFDNGAITRIDALEMNDPDDK